MRQVKFIRSLFVLCALLVAAGMAAAQTAPLRGKVILKQADGAEVPVVGAVIEVIRTDIGGKPYNNKTDKKGEFVFAGLPLGKLIVSVSAPNISPQVVPAQLGGDLQTIIVAPGDGRRLTPDEAKAAMSGGTNTGGTAATGGGNGSSAPAPAPRSESAEDRKKREEEQAKYNAAVENNKKIESNNAVIQRTFKAGNDAFNAKRYDEAIAQYTEGINADPEHPGAPVLLTNRSVALRIRGVENFNASIKDKDAAKSEAAKRDFKDAAESADRAVKLLTAAPAPTDPAQQTQFNKQKYDALAARAEAYRLYVAKADQSKATEGAAAYNEYISAETDPAKKNKAQMALAQMLFDSSSDVAGYERALAEYRKVLVTEPDNVDALAGAGLTLFNLGYINNQNKEQLQEAANFLQAFVDKAPETHQLKASAKEVLDNLKAQQIKATGKPTTGGRRGKG